MPYRKCRIACQDHPPPGALTVHKKRTPVTCKIVHPAMRPSAGAACDGGTIIGVREAGIALFVQDHTKKRTMHLQSTVVFNKAELAEFVHKIVHS